MLKNKLYYCSNLFLWVASLLVVALGDPTRIEWLGVVSAIAGYALFWKGLETRLTLKRKAIEAGVWFFFMQLIHLSWMTSIMYQGLYILFVWAFLSLGMAMQFAVLSAFVLNKDTLTWKKACAAAGMWALFEWSRLYFLCGFTFSMTGIAAASHPWSLQLASLVGIYGLSFWVILSNISIMKTWKEGCARNFAIAAVIVSFPFVFGALKIAMTSKEKGTPFQVALVQTGLLISQRSFVHEYKEHFMTPDVQWERILYALKNEVKAECDLIVLPEAAVPFCTHKKIYPVELVKNIAVSKLGPEAAVLVDELRSSEVVSNAFWCKLIAKYFNCPVLIGLDDYDGINAYNAAIYVHPDKEGIERYEKQILLPLVEYLPFNWLLNITKQFSINSFFTPGIGNKTFQAKEPFCVSICCEETFAHFMRKAVNHHAQFIVNISNDGWYPFSNLPEIHFQYGRLRAVENGVPLVRACNSGITAAVDPHGNIIRRLTPRSRDKSHDTTLGVLYCSVDIKKLNTLYSRTGNSLVVMLSCLSLINYSVFFRIKKRVLI